MKIWHPIQDLPEDWQSLAHEELQSLATLWEEQRLRLESTSSYRVFLERMRRKIAIETGIIERLYSIDRGTTQLMIEHGIDEALLQHGSTNMPVAQVVALIRDQEQAITGIFDFVASQRTLSASYIKQLHQFLTQHQEYTEAIDQFGNYGRVALLRGDWKKHPNNPQRNGEVYHYCPPEQVASQMDYLIDLHLRHQADGVAPDVEAAWLHHRFAQIHPFQDGNGRVARVLASLIFIRQNWFPLVLTRDDRDDYIRSLEQADAGQLEDLVSLFARAQKQAFLSSLSLSEEVLSEDRTTKAILDAAVEKLKQKQLGADQAAKLTVQQYALSLFSIAEARLEETKDLIVQALSAVAAQANVYTKQASHDETARNGFYRYQIIQAARKHEYFAYLQGFKCWLALAISVEKGIRVELVISFHEIGYQQPGVLICTAIGTRMVSGSDDMQVSGVEDVETLSDLPFEFTYLEDADKLRKRFEKWLESAIQVGLEYWRRNI